MKKILIVALAASASAFATPALAQSTGTVTVDGSVADRCLFTGDTATILLGELAASGSGATAGKLDTAKLDSSPDATLTGWCNGIAATIKVEAQPLMNTDFTGTAPDGFTRRVDYSATATANGATPNDTSLVSGAGTAESIGMFTGSVVVSLASVGAGTDLLVAGDYQGQVIVTLTPNVSFNLPEVE